MTFWPRPAPLRTLLIAQFVLVVAAAAVAAAWLVHYWLLPMVRSQAQEEQQRATSMALKRMETSLDNAEQLAQALGRMLSMEGREQVPARAAFKLLLNQLTQNAYQYEGMYWIGADRGVRELGLPPSLEVQASQWRGHHFPPLPVLQEAQARGQARWSDQYQSPVMGSAVVALAAPVHNDFLLLELSVDHLAQSVAKSAGFDGLLVLVTDGKGRLLAASEPMLPQNERDMAQLPVVRAALEGSPRFDGLSYRQTAYQGTAHRSDRLGWVVYVGYPEALAESSRRTALEITSLTLLLSLLVGILTLSALAGLIQRRMDRTVAYAQAVAGGRYDPPARQSGIRELEHLDNSLVQMADTIQRREQQLRAIVETTPTLAIQWFDRQGRVLDWNPAAQTVLGWTREEALGKTLDQLIYTPEQQRAFMEVLAGIARTGQPFGPYEGEVRHRNGELRAILSSTYAIPGMDGSQIFVCTDIDITELKQKEAAIRASEEKFNLFFNASPVAVGVMEKQGGKYLYLDVNRAWENLMGYRREEVLGTGISRDGIVAESSARKQLMASLEGKRLVPWLETWARRADGTTFLAEGAIGQVNMQGKDLVIYSIHDVTLKHQMEQDLRALNAELEQRIQKRTETLTQTNEALQQAVEDLQMAQAQLVRSEKLAALGSLVAGVAHELNTPIGNGLMAISSLSHKAKTFRTLAESGLKRSDLTQFVTQVETAGDIACRNLARASELISSFKQVAVDQTSSQRRQFDLAELVHEIELTLQPMLKRTPYSIETRVEPGLAMDSYPGPLGQVLSNLIQNAVVHAFQGREDGHVVVQAQRVNGLVELSVSDDGVGIPAELLGKVFDPFFTTRLGQGGSGLGLHIAHNMVSSVLGGQIDVRNRPEGGTVFTVRCPQDAPMLNA